MVHCARRRCEYWLKLSARDKRRSRVHCCYLIGTHRCNASIKSLHCTERRIVVQLVVLERYNLVRKSLDEKITFCEPLAYQIYYALVLASVFL